MMQQYTRQQREGGVRYGTRTLVGNWNEELEAHSTTLKNFVSKQETGTLKLDRCFAAAQQR
jgi:hypothetical protein